MDFLDDPVEDIEYQAKSYVSSFKNEKTIAKQRYWILKLEKTAEDLFKRKASGTELAPRDLNALICQLYANYMSI